MEITLRPYNASDAEAFLKWASDKKLAQYSRLTHCPTLADALSYLLEVVILHPWYRAICLEGRTIGFICLDRTGDCRGLTGFALGRSYWGRGIMTKAVKMAAKAAIEEIEGFERVEAVTHLENRAPQKVLEKAGFLREDMLQKYMVIKEKPTDIVMFSFLKSHDLDASM